jgi:hypothetical protein
MGWCGYSLYSGDETQTRHIDFCEWAKIEPNISENWLELNKTKIPEPYRTLFQQNLSLVIKKMPAFKFWNEDMAIEWQMLLSLLIDNNLKIPNKVFEQGITATEFLLGEHCDDFTSPSKRRAVLRYFIKKATKAYYNQNRIK